MIYYSYSPEFEGFKSKRQENNLPVGNNFTGGNKLPVGNNLPKVANLRKV
jgi:hypothetical protein